MLELRFYKNHAAARTADLEVDRLWAEAEAWLTVTAAAGSPLRRAPHYDAKYRGYKVWVLAPAPDFFALGVVPCEAFVAVEDGGARSLHSYQHPAAPAGGVAALPKAQWHQLGRPSAPAIYLLHLGINPRFDEGAELCRDEASQKRYPYVLLRVLVLRRAG